MRHCEISAKRKDSDHHDIIDLTAFNTDGFDVTGPQSISSVLYKVFCDWPFVEVR